jgi:hypothetical protein
MRADRLLILTGLWCFSLATAARDLDHHAQGVQNAAGDALLAAPWRSFLDRILSAGKVTAAASHGDYQYDSRTGSTGDCQLSDLSTHDVARLENNVTRPVENEVCDGTEKAAGDQSQKDGKGELPHSACCTMYLRRPACIAL